MENLWPSSFDEIFAKNRWEKFACTMYYYPPSPFTENNHVNSLVFTYLLTSYMYWGQIITKIRMTFIAQQHSEHKFWPRMTTYLSDHLDGLVMLLCNTRWRFYLYRTKLLLLLVMCNWLCNGTNVPKLICKATCCIDLWISKVKASTVPISCKYCWLRANKKRWLRNRTYMPSSPDDILLEYIVHRRYVFLRLK